MNETIKDRVRSFWEDEPCGTRGAGAEEGSVAFFSELEGARRKREPFIDDFARFEEWRGRTVLEVGVGPGTDFVRFARAGAIATGVDLTAHGVALTRRRLELEGLSGTVTRADAEALPFPDDAFDFVYSWGVIHHTERPEAAAAEIFRVTRPGGSICVMVYHLHSLVAVQSWLVHGLGRGHPFRSIRRLIWENHESYGTRAYTRDEARALFPRMADLRVTPVVTPYDLRLTRSKHLPRVMRSAIPSRLGWFLVIEGRKD